MPIPLETQRQIIPTVKLMAIKQQVIAHIVDMRVMPMTEFGTGAPKLRPDGKQATQDKVTLLVIKGTAMIKDAASEEMRQVQPVEPVVIWFQGHRRWDWVQAKKAYGAPINCGDVLRVTYIGDEQGKGSMPKKIWAVDLRAADPVKEIGGIAASEALYHQLNQAAPVPPSGEDDGWVEPDDDLPF